MLAEAQQDLGAWVAAHVAAAEVRGPRRSYESVLLDAIYRFHRTGSFAEARAYLRDAMRSARFTNNEKMDQAESRLLQYTIWCERSRPVVADFRVGVNFPLHPEVTLGGRISRVDVDAQVGRYRAVILGSVPGDWPNGVRFPLLQRVVARTYGRDEDDVQVCIQQLNGDELTCRSYDRRARDRAEKQARALAARIARALTRVG